MILNQSSKENNIIFILRGEGGADAVVIETCLYVGAAAFTISMILLEQKNFFVPT